MPTQDPHQERSIAYRHHLSCLEVASCFAKRIIKYVWVIIKHVWVWAIGVGGYLIRELRPNPSKSATIDIVVRVGRPEDDQWVKSWLTIDSGSDLNLISPKTLREVFKRDVTPIEGDESLSCGQLDSQTHDIVGYVDLVWKGGRSRKRHTTRFYVPAIDEPDFEMILSCATSLKLRLMTLRCAATKVIQAKTTQNDRQEEASRKKEHEDQKAENERMLAGAPKASSNAGSSATVDNSTDNHSNTRKA